VARGLLCYSYSFGEKLRKKTFKRSVRDANGRRKRRIGRYVGAPGGQIPVAQGAGVGWGGGVPLWHRIPSEIAVSRASGCRRAVMSREGQLAFPRGQGSGSRGLVERAVFPSRSGIAGDPFDGSWRFFDGMYGPGSHGCCQNLGRIDRGDLEREPLPAECG
jgi:hypothetical protein